jgi:dihydrofolate reductase
MRLVAVVAASENDVIGRDNALPWHLPADLAYFKRVTMGRPMLMGRRTYESIGRPLPGRRNVILSRSGFSAPGTDTVATLDEARELLAGEPELMVIGGAEVFRITLPQMDLIHLTRVHCWIDGDVFMPELAANQWREVAREERAADERNRLAISFTQLERIRPSPAV